MRKLIFTTSSKYTIEELFRAISKRRNISKKEAFRDITQTESTRIFQRFLVQNLPHYLNATREEQRTMQVMGFLSAKSPSVSKQYHYYRRHHLQQPHFRKDNLIWSQTTETVIADDPVQ